MSVRERAPGTATIPWAIRSSNLTYIGEIPLTYMNETDRYLAFSDLLFSVLEPGDEILTTNQDYPRMITTACNAATS